VDINVNSDLGKFINESWMVKCIEHKINWISVENIVLIQKMIVLIIEIDR